LRAELLGWRRFMATIVGTTGDDTLVGVGLEADSILGLAGNDSLSGGDGDDTLIGGAGADTLDSSTTFSATTADYSQSSSAVIINLSDAAPESGGDAESDVLLQVERVIGTAFNDSIVGIYGGTFIGANNLLWGGDGDDTLVGGIGGGSAFGADTFVGGAGADLIIGGDNGPYQFNSAWYTGSTAGVNVNLSDGAPETGGDAEGDTLTGIDFLTGSAFGDTLIGDGLANSLAGGAGHDIIDGGDGSDSVSGGAGSDSLTGGAGNDLLSYKGAMGSILVNLGDGLPESGGDAEGDTVSGFESLIGGYFRDTLIGDEGDNYISGGGIANIGQASDLLVGGGGNDTLIGTSETTLIGGAGADLLDGGFFRGGTADYSSSSAGVNVKLGDGAPEGGGDAEGIRSLRLIASSDLTLATR
jgi:Ca2+-binding RTX toxin-like protein